MIKRDSGENSDNIRKNAPAYFSLTAVVMIVWAVTIPFWPTFIRNVMGVREFMPIYQLSLISLEFYIVFAFNNVVDSIFYGRGRTDLMLYQSLIVNIVFYGTAFALYAAGRFRPTLIGMAVMFGLGIVFDPLVTFIMYFRFRKGLSLE